MKTISENRDIERFGVIKESNFKIKASGKAFQILSSGLYSDKIKAIIRELSCNAWDAHVDAGTEDKKFDVHLPTILNPTFYIRDYGTGLSKEDIETIYTTYFESTKTDSNDVIGCLGLGSKSPFSYVDMFTVISFFNGTQYVYSAILSESGTPTINLINESETDEPNGLKIQFSVKKRDIGEFTFKAPYVFRYFKSLPSFVGANPEIKEVEYCVKNKDWGIRKEFRGGSAQAIMGNVAYPLNLTKEDFSRQEKEILYNFPIDLFFEIGEVDIAASREGLSYDEKTVAAILNKTKDIISKETERIYEGLDQQESYWDAVSWIVQQKAENKMVEMIFRNKKLFYKDEEIVPIFFVNPNDYGGSHGRMSDEFNINVVSRKTRRERRTYQEVEFISKPTSCSKIYISKSSKIFINNCTNRHMVRVRKFMEDNPHISNVYLIKANEEKLVKKFKKDIKLSSIQKLDEIELPKVVRKKRDSKSFVKKGILILDPHMAINSYSKYNIWNEIDNFDMGEGGYYVVLNRWNVLTKQGNYLEGNEVLKCFLKTYSLIFPDSPPKIYGVRNAQSEKFKKHDKWIDFNDYFSEVLKNYLETDSIKEDINLYYYSGIRFGNWENIFYQVKQVKDIKEVKWYKDCKCSDVKYIMEILNKIKEFSKLKTKSKIKDLLNSARYVGIEVKSQSADFIKLVETLGNSYPLVNLINVYELNSQRCFYVLDYINSMVSQNSFNKGEKNE